MSSDEDYQKLAQILVERAKAAPSLETLKESAQKKRDQQGFTFQKPMADRTEAQRKQQFANEQYVGRSEAVKGITDTDIKEVRERGVPRNEEGEATGPPAKPAAVKVPTRSRDTYIQAGLDPKTYEKEETETGDWRKKLVPPGATAMKTPYFRGQEQEDHRVTVGPDGKLKKGQADYDTTQAAGGHMSGSSAKREIFAMNPEGGVFTTDPQQTTDAAGVVTDPHHSSLVAGGKVVGAGELEVEKGRVKAVSDVSGHYKPTPAQTADVVNELEAQGVQLIDTETVDVEGKPTMKRAKVELSYNEHGEFKGRTQVPKGKPKAPEKPVGSGRDKLMTKDAKTGAITMDAERFAQTGGNLQQIKGKGRVNEDIADLGQDNPHEALAKLADDRELNRAQRDNSSAADQAAEAARKAAGGSLTWTPLLEKLAEDLGAEWVPGDDWWEVGGQSVNSDDLLALVAGHDSTQPGEPERTKGLIRGLRGSAPAGWEPARKSAKARDDLQAAANQAAKEAKEAVPAKDLRWTPQLEKLAETLGALYVPGKDVAPKDSWKLGGTDTTLDNDSLLALVMSYDPSAQGEPERTKNLIRGLAGAAPRGSQRAPRPGKK